MKTFSVNKKSGHYQILHKWTDHSVPDNICSYMRELLFLSIFLIVIGVFGGVIAFFALTPYLTLISGLYWDFYAPVTDFWQIILITEIVAMIVWGCSVIWGRYKEYRWKKLLNDSKNPPKTPKPPSVLKLWWTSFKEKNCVKLKFED